jgi:ribosome biogenesis SPOUT family RNA methylase Rps3
MTTDTAVRVTRTVIQDQLTLDQIQYIDQPELKLNQHESTQMPFRYIRGENGQPVMPEVCGSSPYSINGL